MTSIHAEFEPFVDKGRFANRFMEPQSRLRVLAPPKRRRERVMKSRSPSVLRAILKAARVEEARRWIPLNPLLAYAMKAELAFRVRNGAI